MLPNCSLELMETGACDMVALGSVRGCLSGEWMQVVEDLEVEAVAVGGASLVEEGHRFIGGWRHCALPAWHFDPCRESTRLVHLRSWACGKVAIDSRQVSEL